MYESRGCRADRSRLSVALAAVALALLVVPASASAAHDSFASPEPLVLGYGLADDNTGATEQSGEPFTVAHGSVCPNGGGQMGATLWYGFTGTGRDVTLFTYNTSVDTVIAVYDASDRSLVDCNDDSGAGTTSLVTVPTDAGGGYLLQVGGFDGSGGADQGPFSVAGLSPPPNDEGTGAVALTPGQPFSGDNLGAVDEGSAEDLVCEADASAPLGKTVWAKFTVSAEGDAVISASGFDTVMQIYRSGENTPFACNDDGRTGQFGPSRIGVRLGPGEYFVQVGGYGVGPGADDGNLTIALEFTVDNDLDDDGSARPQDCNDRDGRIRPGVADVPENGIDEDCSGADAQRLDRDGDGFNAPQDCNDGNAGVRPGGSDFPGDGVDQDCDGADDPAGLIAAGYNWDVATDGLTIRKLVVVRATPNMRIRVTCRGRRCFRAFTIRPRRTGTVNVAARLRRRQRRRGHNSVVRLLITEPGTIGKIGIFRFRRGKTVDVKRDCLTPGTNKRMKCPNA